MQIATPQAAQYSFTVAQNGDAHVFTYKKAKYDIGTIFFGVVTFAFLSLLPAMIFGVVAWVLLTFVLPVVLCIVLNATRKDGSFTVTPDAIEVGGVSYKRSDVHNIFIKVPYEHEQLTHIEHRRSGGGFIVGGDRAAQIGMGAAAATTQVVGGVVNAAGMVSRGAAMGLKKQFIRRNHKIGFLYGERRILLASGLAEKSSPALLRKIEHVLECAS